MIQAYNHFLVEYSSRLSSHSSAHKQKELRDVYTRIVSMNRHSAWYKLDLSKEKRFYSLTLKDSALTLSERLTALSDVFQKPSAVQSVRSSDSASVTASLLDRSANSFAEPVAIRVRSLAQPQVNEGQFLQSNGEGPAPASYHFTVQSDAESYEFSYNISSSSTNRELMTKLTDFINKSSVSIRACVEDSPDQEFSRIVLTSSETGVPDGESQIFHLTDSKEQAAGLVSWFGLDRVAQQPSNAVFSVNGKKYSNMRNDFVLNRSLTVHLKQIPYGEVILSPETGGNQVEKALGDFLDSYNTMIGLTRNGPAGNRRSARLQSELNHVFSSGLEELNLAGIRRREDFTLISDPESLRSPETQSRLRALFEEPDGLLAQLSRKMQDIALNPMEYVDKIIIAYPNLSKSGFSNPYSTSIYSGMMFNSYC